jgi:hypothetical protein
MIPQRWTRRSADGAAPAGPSTPGARPRTPGNAGAGGGNGSTSPPPPSTDWRLWLRTTERKRRLLARLDGHALRPFWDAYFVRATDASFRLDGLTVSEADLTGALAPGWGRRSLGARQQQRVRNHVAILRSVERMLARGHVLKPDDVVRWYTSVACGLSTTRLDEAAASRLDGVVRQLNSPHLRLAPAVQSISRLHHQLLVEPVVPGFNGILARLPLRWHLGRCGLPPVLFDPVRDGGVLGDEAKLLARLLELIDQSHDAMSGA